MAQLDRLLSVMVSNRADLLVLTENDVAKLRKGTSSHPVTKQALSAPQLIALLREIAPAEAVKLLEGGRPASFGYVSDDGVFLAEATREGGKWTASLKVDEDARAKALKDAFTVVEERAPVEQMTPVQGHPKAPFPSPDSLDGMEDGNESTPSGGQRPAPFRRPQPAAAPAPSPAPGRAAAPVAEAPTSASGRVPATGTSGHSGTS